MRKDVFIDRHKKPDMIEDQNLFLTQVEEPKPYIVQFDKNGGI